LHMYTRLGEPLQMLFPILGIHNVGGLFARNQSRLLWSTSIEFHQRKRPMRVIKFEGWGPPTALLLVPDIWSADGQWSSGHPEPRVALP
jgi:hypothetical protein